MKGVWEWQGSDAPPAAAATAGDTPATPRPPARIAAAPPEPAAELTPTELLDVAHEVVEALNEKPLPEGVMSKK